MSKIHADNNKICITELLKTLDQNLHKKQSANANALSFISGWPKPVKTMTYRIAI